MADPNDTQDSASIYSAPAADTAVAPEGDLLDIFVGPKNNAFYMEKFRGFESGGGSASWNWPAFFITAYWLLYRKMWAAAAMYWFGLPIILIILSTIIDMGAGAGIGGMFYNVAYLAIGFVIVPIFINKYYYNHAKKKIEKVSALYSNEEQRRMEVARIGGTSNVVWIILVIVFFMVGILAAIAIPAYQDYTIRAQVSEGLNLSAGAKAAVTEAYQDTGQFPADNNSAGLVAPEQINGSYVEGVYVEDGVIYVLYGNNAHDIILGAEIALVPRATDSSVSWVCESSSIANKHLPAACRS